MLDAVLPSARQALSPAAIMASKQLRCWAHSHSPNRTLHPLEQRGVIKALKTHNVVVSARPDAGKAATIEALVQENPEVPVSLTTYSKRL